METKPLPALGELVMGYFKTGVSKKVARARLTDDGRELGDVWIDERGEVVPLVIIAWEPLASGNGGPRA